MAFNLFKKKEEDNFSDFSAPKDESMAMGDSSAADSVMSQPNMGLPLDGDMTNTGLGGSMDQIGQGGSSNESLGLPPENTMRDASSPTSFNDFNNMNNVRPQEVRPSQSFEHSTQSINSIESTIHKPTRNELMAKVNNIERDMELVNAKLDNIKSLLESMAHRIVHIEKAANVHNGNEEVKW